MELHCVQAGKIKFCANAKWSDCRVSKGHWFATLEFIDMYQAQYCLGKGDGACAERALLVFGNRAFTPNAKLMLQRIDPGAAIKVNVWPDMDSMSAQATLSSGAGAGAREMVAEVELGSANDQFTVKKVTLAQKAD